MSIKIVNDTNNGSATIKAPDVAGDYTVTAPNRSMTMAGVDEVIGVGQTWQDVTGSRALGVTYTNTTGKPIYIVARTASAAGNAQFNFAINGVVLSAYTLGQNYENIMQFIVPNSYTYAINLQANIGTISKWSELR